LKRVLLLGGGHAHVHVLRELARAPLASAELLLVTPHPRQMYSGMAPGIVAGHYRAEQGAIALVPLATAARVPVVLASAVALDAAARQVQLSDGRVAEYDVLSLDTGATIDRGRIEGAREHGLFRAADRALRAALRAAARPGGPARARRGGDRRRRGRLSSWRWRSSTASPVAATNVPASRSSPAGRHRWPATRPR